MFPWLLDPLGLNWLPKKEKPITMNEILDLHQYLKDFDGDIYDLFGNPKDIMGKELLQSFDASELRRKYVGI